MSRTELTPNELRILQLLANGKRQIDIAQSRKCSPAAIGQALWRIRSVMNAQTSENAVAMALRTGLIE